MLEKKQREDYGGNWGLASVDKLDYSRNGECNDQLGDQKMDSRLLVFTALCMVAAGESQMAKAQSVDFSCPRAGTVVIGQDTDAVRAWTVRYAGVSNDDPYVCNRVDSFGKVHSRLFNYFAMGDQFDPKVAQEALISLLSGSQKSVTFEYIWAVNRARYRETWTFLRHETLTVDGKPFDTIVFFKRTHDLTGPYGWTGDYTLWFDPKNGLWLKSELHILAGTTINSLGNNYKAVSVTLPP
jgi:hypothetical protein